jgi:hypothetical protein
MYLDDEQKKRVQELAFILYQSVSNLHWLTGGVNVEMDSLEKQSVVVAEKLDNFDEELKKIYAEVDGPGDTPEQKAWEPDPDDLKPPGGIG